MGTINPDLMGSAGLELPANMRGDRVAVAALKTAQLPMRDRLMSLCARHSRGLGMRQIGAIDVPRGRFGHAQMKAM